MRRFWKQAGIGRSDDGWTVLLDARPLRTPARRPVALPTEPLAEAVAAEWAQAPEEFDPRALGLTGLANAAIDRIAPDRPAFAAGLARYGESDLLYYRADTPPELAARQRQAWDPLLAWARRRYDVDFVTTIGVRHVEQPAATIERLRSAACALDSFRLAALSPLVTIGGSLIAGLALAEGAIGAAPAWDAVSLDDRWQLEKWGEDPEARAVLDARQAEFLGACRMLDLLSE